MDDLPEAIKRYEQSLPIAETLARSNPDNPSLAQDVEITKNRLAELNLISPASPVLAPVPLDPTPSSTVWASFT